MVDPTACLTLSGLETVFLSDALRNGITVKAIEDELSCVRPLLLNLGSAYRELVTPKPDGIKAGPISIEVTEQQCWLMRALVRTGDLGIDGKTNVGVPLLLKLYGLLLQLESGIDLPVVDVVDVPYPTKEEVPE